MKNTFERSFMPRLQKGMAGTLMIVLIGLGLTATALSLMYGLRGGQNSQVALHATTNAQQLAWNGVEAVRGYLSTLTESTIKALTSSNTINLSSYSTSTNVLTARVTSNSVPTPESSSTEPSSNTTNSDSGTVTTTTSSSGTTYIIPVEITATISLGTSAQSQSKILVIYQSSFATKTVKTDTTTGGSGNGAGSSTSVAAITVNKDLTLTGDITLTTASGSVTALNIDGNLTLTNANIYHLSVINATGNISINSAINVDSINTNGSVILSGAANVTNAINAKGAVTLSGGSAHAGSISSNSDVTLSGGSAYVSNDIKSQGNVTVSGGSAYATNIYAMGHVEWTSSANASTIQSNSYVIYAGGNSSTKISANGYASLSGSGASSVTANGNVSITYGSIGSVYATGNLSASNGNVTTGTIGGTKNCPSYNPCAGVTVTSGYTATPNTVTVSSVATVTAGHPTIDAYALLPSANYIFSIDSSGYRKVTVQNVNGIANGTYYLGQYSNSSDEYEDYLCTSVSSANVADPLCTAPTFANKLATICRGYSNYNSCISYNSGTWTLAGARFAPGVLWFNGNLTASNGTYYNTMIASGNIKTSGNLTFYSVNYSGYYPICANANNSSNIYQSPYARFAALYPTSFCNISTTTFVPQSVGNIAFLAGGYPDGSSSSYVGGNIELGSSNKIYGSIMAGNNFNTGGSTLVKGYVSISALQGTNSTWSGSTTIDLTGLPSSYDPGTTPCMANCSTTNSSTTTTNTQSLIIRSTRYE